jgi:MFS family permease
LLAHSVLTQVITFMLRPTAAYRALELGIPTMWLGVLSASFALAPLVLAIPTGRVVDRFGERGVMVAGAS